MPGELPRSASYASGLNVVARESGDTGVLDLSIEDKACRLS